jgi:hypothetical protein
MRNAWLRGEWELVEDIANGTAQRASEPGRGKRIGGELLRHDRI